MVQLGTVLGQQAQKSNDVQYQFGETDSITFPQYRKENINLDFANIFVDDIENTGSALVLGNPTFGVLGSNYLGPLGSDGLGSTATRVFETQVLCDWIETFDDQTYLSPIGSAELAYNLDETDTLTLVEDLSPNGNDGTPTGFTVNDGVDTNVGYNNFYRYTSNAYYSFSGNANDESLNSNDGVVTGATLTTDRFGNTDNAYEFNANGYIDIGMTTFDTSKPYFISVVLTADNGVNNYKEFISKALNSYYFAEFNFRMTSTGTIQLLVGDGVSGYGTGMTSTLTYDDGVPVRFTFVYDGTNYYMYKNGVLDNSVVVGSTYSSTAKIFIGRRGEINNGYFIGKIEEVTLGQYSLTSTQVTELDTILQSQKLIDYEDESGACTNASVSGSGIRIQNITDSGTFSANFKVKINQPDVNFKRIIDYGDRRFLILVNTNGYLEASVRNDLGTYYAGSTIINFGEEYTLGFSFDGDKSRLYVNGVFEDESASFTSSMRATGDIYLLNENGNNYELNAGISVFRFWKDKVLTESEFTAEHNSPHYPVTGEGLVFATDFTRGNSKDINYLVDMGDGDIGWNLQAGKTISTGYTMDMTKSFSFYFELTRQELYDSVTRLFTNLTSYTNSVLISQRYNENMRFRYGPSGTGHVIQTPDLTLGQKYRFLWVHNAWDGSNHKYSVYIDGVKLDDEWYPFEKTGSAELVLGYSDTKDTTIHKAVVIEKALEDGGIINGETALGEVGQIFSLMENDANIAYGGWSTGSLTLGSGETILSSSYSDDVELTNFKNIKAIPYVKPGYSVGSLTTYMTTDSGSYWTQTNNNGVVVNLDTPKQGKMVMWKLVNNSSDTVEVEELRIRSEGTNYIGG